MMHGGVHPRPYKSPGTSCFWSFTHSISRSALELSSLTHSISPASLRRPRQVSAHRRSLFRPPLLCVYRFVLKSFRFFRWRTRIVSRFGGKRVVLERCTPTCLVRMRPFLPRNLYLTVIVVIRHTWASRGIPILRLVASTHVIVVA
jgi:hypothetical protein